MSIMNSGDKTMARKTYGINSDGSQQYCGHCQREKDSWDCPVCDTPELKAVRLTIKENTKKLKLRMDAEIKELGYSIPPDTLETVEHQRGGSSINEWNEELSGDPLSFSA